MTYQRGFVHTMMRLRKMSKILLSVLKKVLKAYSEFRRDIKQELII